MEIPGFRIIRTIGQGGMATVYLAEQESLGRAVVLKTVSAGGAKNAGHVNRFLNEARIVASLRHPHIITIYDVGTAGDLVYISMEYVEGGDLRKRLHEKLAPAYALDLITRVASALDLAHREGVIHRDVKPANILFRNDATPLLSDFGIAKQVEADTELTSTGMILGSPFYMSPEQAEGADVDGRTDIYSLGVILYEMLAGRRPYLGDSQIKIIMQHLQAPVPELPDALRHYQPLISKMLAKRREDRFPNAATLVRRVAELRSHKQVKVVPVQPAAPVAAPTPQPAKPPPLPLHRVRRTRPGRTRLWILASTAVITATGALGFYMYAETLKASSIILASAKKPLSGGVVPRKPSAPTGLGVPPAATGSPSDSAAAGPGLRSSSPASQPIKDDVKRALEWLARNSLRENRLVEPATDNAHYYYSRLRDLDPRSEVAARGFAEIAESFVVQAEKELANRNYDLALEYVAQGLRVQPTNKDLLTLRDLIEKHEKTLLDNIVEFFKGLG